MKKIFKALKVAFVYIGTMVGAGFATGQEIQLYFLSTDILTLVVSSIFTGLFCVLMLVSGQKQIFNEKAKKIINGIFALSGIITVGIMLSGIKEIVKSPYILLLSLFVCMVVAVFGNRAMKAFNVICVPLIIIAVFVTAIVNNGKIVGSFKIFNGLGYSAMNVFFESALMYREGENMTKSEISLAGVFVSILIFTLIFCMRKACAPIVGVMPYIEASRSNGLGWVALIVVILAIYSTIVNCLEVTFDYAKKHFEKTLVYTFVFIASLFISVFPFDLLIAKIYPIFSYLGIILNIFTFVLLLTKLIKVKANTLIVKKY